MTGRGGPANVESLDAERLLKCVPGGFPPPYSKLGLGTWRLAARLYVESRGRITLSTLCDECAISHRTAWRIRDTLRDSELVMKERRQLAEMTRPSPPERQHARSRP